MQPAPPARSVPTAARGFVPSPARHRPPTDGRRPSAGRRAARRGGAPALLALLTLATALPAAGAQAATATGTTVQAAPRTAATSAPAAVRTDAAGTTALRSPADAARKPQPGDPVSARAQGFKPNPLTPSDARSWRMTYRSTSATGRPNTVSGTVIVPRDGRSGARPILGYAVGTVGLADKCAPSRTFPTGRTKEGSLIQLALQRGWAVAVTDYEGLGTPGVHTYTVGRSAGHAVLDAVRAATRLPEAGLAEGSPIGIMGYSQGGQASAWAAELHSSYAPELDVVGTATGGVPRDLLEVAEFNEGRAGSGLVAMAAVGQDAAFPELDLDSYLNTRGRLQRRIAESECVELASGTWPFGRIDQITDRNPLEQPDWQRRMDESRLGRTAPQAPVFLYHGILDSLIPYRSGTGLRDAWRARGADVTFRTLPLEHTSGAVTGAPLAVSWLADRFAD